MTIGNNDSRNLGLSSGIQPGSTHSRTKGDQPKLQKATSAVGKEAMDAHAEVAASPPPTKKDIIRATRQVNRALTSLNAKIQRFQKLDTLTYRTQTEKYRYQKAVESAIKDINNQLESVRRAKKLLNQKLTQISAGDVDESVAQKIQGQFGKFNAAYKVKLKEATNLRDRLQNHNFVEAAPTLTERWQKALWDEDISMTRLSDGVQQVMNKVVQKEKAFRSTLQQVGMGKIPDKPVTGAAMKEWVEDLSHVILQLSESASILKIEQPQHTERIENIEKTLQDLVKKRDELFAELDTDRISALDLTIQIDAHVKYAVANRSTNEIRSMESILQAHEKLKKLDALSTGFHHKGSKYESYHNIIVNYQRLAHRTFDTAYTRRGLSNLFSKQKIHEMTNEQTKFLMNVRTAINSDQFENLMIMDPHAHEKLGILIDRLRLQFLTIGKRELSSSPILLDLAQIKEAIQNINKKIKKESPDANLITLPQNDAIAEAFEEYQDLVEAAHLIDSAKTGIEEYEEASTSLTRALPKDFYAIQIDTRDYAKKALSELAALRNSMEDKLFGDNPPKDARAFSNAIRKIDTFISSQKEIFRPSLRVTSSAFLLTQTESDGKYRNEKESKRRSAGDANEAASHVSRAQSSESMAMPSIAARSRSTELLDIARNIDNWMDQARAAANKKNVHEATSWAFAASEGLKQLDAWLENPEITSKIDTTRMRKVVYEPLLEDFYAMAGYTPPSSADATNPALNASFFKHITPEVTELPKFYNIFNLDWEPPPSGLMTDLIGPEMSSALPLMNVAFAGIASAHTGMPLFGVIAGIASMPRIRQQHIDVHSEVNLMLDLPRCSTRKEMTKALKSLPIEKLINLFDRLEANVLSNPALEANTQKRDYYLSGIYQLKRQFTLYAPNMAAEIESRRHDSAIAQAFKTKWERDSELVYVLRSCEDIAKLKDGVKPERVAATQLRNLEKLTEMRDIVMDEIDRLEEITRRTPQEDRDLRRENENLARITAWISRIRVKEKGYIERLKVPVGLLHATWEESRRMESLDKVIDPKPYISAIKTLGALTFDYALDYPRDRLSNQHREQLLYLLHDLIPDREFMAILKKDPEVAKIIEKVLEEDFEEFVYAKTRKFPGDSADSLEPREHLIPQYRSLILDKVANAKSAQEIEDAREFIRYLFGNPAVSNQVTLDPAVKQVVAPILKEIADNPNILSEHILERTAMAEARIAEIQKRVSTSEQDLKQLNSDLATLKKSPRFVEFASGRDNEQHLLNLESERTNLQKEFGDFLRDFENNPNAFRRSVFNSLASNPVIAARWNAILAGYKPAEEATVAAAPPQKLTKREQMLQAADHYMKSYEKQNVEYGNFKRALIDAQLELNAANLNLPHDITSKADIVEGLKESLQNASQGLLVSAKNLLNFINSLKQDSELYKEITRKIDLEKLKQQSVGQSEEDSKYGASITPSTFGERDRKYAASTPRSPTESDSKYASSTRPPTSFVTPTDSEVEESMTPTSKLEGIIFQLNLLFPRYRLLERSRASQEQLKVAAQILELKKQLAQKDIPEDLKKKLSDLEMNVLQLNNIELELLNQAETGILSESNLNKLPELVDKMRLIGLYSPDVSIRLQKIAQLQKIEELSDPLEDKTSLEISVSYEKMLTDNKPELVTARKVIDWIENARKVVNFRIGGEVELGDLQTLKALSRKAESELSEMQESIKSFYKKPEYSTLVRDFNKIMAETSRGQLFADIRTLR